ncbi:MAG: small acid-soluble spore protein Tlp, partial [Bacillota bacterium]|nr:small acid-soluble spore protein Tlp [Bacillota bacterium]
KHIDNTVENIRESEKAIAVTDNPKTKKDLEAKNERREYALDSYRSEIKDEARDKENGYK